MERRFAQVGHGPVALRLMACRTLSRVWSMARWASWTLFSNRAAVARAFVSLAICLLTVNRYVIVSILSFRLLSTRRGNPRILDWRVPWETVMSG